MKEIVAAKSNCEVTSDADPKFFLKYTDIYVGDPNLHEESFVTSNGNRLVHSAFTDILPCSDSIPMPHP
jgi:hypothetical protein